jgi:hypothetical protein
MSDLLGAAGRLFPYNALYKWLAYGNGKITFYTFLQL